MYVLMLVTSIAFHITALTLSVPRVELRVPESALAVRHDGAHGRLCW